MISKATQRAIFRWIHLIAVIPVAGYVYGNPADVQQYVDGPKYIFIPLLMLTGYWMYAGAAFAIIGVALWLATIRFAGFGWALLGQIVLFVAWKIWTRLQARRAA